MSDPFLAEIVMFAGNFAPRSWAYCSGQLLAIAQNSALFSLLGTTYGGDGRVTFALPDLRGRYPRGSQGGSAGPGLSPVPLGARSGAQTHTMTTSQMPSHSHALGTIDEDGNQAEPAGNLLAESADSYHSGAPTGAMASSAIGNTGGNQSFNILDPYLGMNYIIATQGVFPSRN